MSSSIRRTNSMLLLLFTFGAPLLILFYIIKSDRFPEPNKCIIQVFTIGIFLCYPAGYLNGFFIGDNQDYLAGLTEESLKYLGFLFFVTKMDAFNERMDAIVYGALISLGFATLENYHYVYNMFPQDNSYVTALTRFFTAIPLHAMCGVIMGYHFGIYYFIKIRKHLFMALFIPVITHGVYNFLCDYSLSVILVFLIVVLFYTKKLHEKFVFFQRDKISEVETKT